MECKLDAIQALLPDGYKVLPSSGTTAGYGNVLFEVMELRNLPWLAGRGYNTWGVYASDVECERGRPAETGGRLHRGSYMLVLFESFTDPITTGREELGFAKLWAELPDSLVEAHESTQGKRYKRTHTASWFGYEFMRLELSGLKEHDPATAPALTRKSDIFTHPAQHGILHHRYVPAVGEPGKADASYATFNPPGKGSPKVLRYEAPFASPKPCEPKEETTCTASKEVKLVITPGTFEQLPTLGLVVSGLASLQPGRVREVAMQSFQGASDLCE